MKQIFLTLGKIAIIDDCDFARVRCHKWRAYQKKPGNLWYARTDINGKSISLHQFIAKRFVDHRNGDGLDNRRSNLRSATNSQNCANQLLRRNNTSGFKGVTLHPCGLWQAVTSKNGRGIFLGHYADIEAAAIAYGLGAILFHGDFAKA